MRAVCDIDPDTHYPDVAIKSHFRTHLSRRHEGRHEGHVTFVAVRAFVIKDAE